MREIIPAKLWLGNAHDGRDAGHLMRLGIVAVVNLAAEETAPNLPRSMIYCRFPILDGAQDDDELLVVALHTIVLLIKQGLPTLVHCSAGMSRSPAVVAGAMAIVNGEEPADGLRRITEGQPHDVSPLLWEEVVRACAKGSPLRALGR